MNKFGFKTLHIAALPKSGSTWLKNLLSELTQFGSTVPPDPNADMENHDLPDEENFSHIVKSNSIVKLHTRCNDRNLSIIKNLGFKTVILKRNLRDQCVSNYFYILKNKSHRHNGLYKKISKDDGLFHRATISIEEYVPWINGWEKIANKECNSFKIFSYESLVDETFETLSSIVNFFDLKIPTKEIEECIHKIASKTSFNFDSTGTLGYSLARKGIVGDWKNHFDERHTSLFEEFGH